MYFPFLFFKKKNSINLKYKKKGKEKKPGDIPNLTKLKPIFASSEAILLE